MKINRVTSEKLKNFPLRIIFWEPYSHGHASLAGGYFFFEYSLFISTCFLSLSAYRKLDVYKAENENGMRIWEYSGKYQLIIGGPLFSLHLINRLLLSPNSQSLMMALIFYYPPEISVNPLITILKQVLGRSSSYLLNLGSDAGISDGWHPQVRTLISSDPLARRMSNYRSKLEYE